MKNLKINKSVLLMALTGALTIAAAEGCSTNKKEVRVDTSQEQDDTNKEVKEEVVEVTATPEPTEAPTPKTTKKPKLEKTTYYVNTDVNLKKDPEDKKAIKKISAYNKIKLLFEYNDYSLVKSGKDMGYIKTSTIKHFDGKYVEVNLTKQKIKVYNKKGKMILKSNVVSGLATDPDRETPIGKYKINSKETNRDLVGRNPDGSEKYRSHVNYWMPFYLGYGIHDASWRSYFGGNIYKTNGSHGCVNLPTDFAPKVYQKVDKGTSVLIHK